MSRQQSERDQQTIGRYEVFMHGQDVVMFHTGLDSIRTLKPTEALMLLEWLNPRDTQRVSEKGENA